MKKKLSIIIPTLQKNLTILSKLISTLDNDISVDEIIIIDNSGNGFNNDFAELSKKLVIVRNNTNEYVNPCWNKGKNLAKNDYIAFFNDDLIIPDNFCFNVLKQIKNKTGIIGVSNDIVTNINPSEYKTIKFNNKKPKIKEISYRTNYYGIIMFCHKNSYYEIPHEMKVWCGDDYLFYMNKKLKHKNYEIRESQVFHLHSLTSSNPDFDDVKLNDIKIMQKEFPNWNGELFKNQFYPNTLLEQIFSIKNDKNKNHKIITFLGIKLKIKMQ